MVLLLAWSAAGNDPDLKMYIWTVGVKLYYELNRKRWSVYKN